MIYKIKEDTISDEDAPDHDFRFKNTGAFQLSPNPKIDLGPGWARHSITVIADNSHDRGNGGRVVTNISQKVARPGGCGGRPTATLSRGVAARRAIHEGASTMAANARGDRVVSARVREPASCPCRVIYPQLSRIVVSFLRRAESSDLSVFGWNQMKPSSHRPTFAVSIIAKRSVQLQLVADDDQISLASLRLNILSIRPLSASPAWTIEACSSYKSSMADSDMPVLAGGERVRLINVVTGRVSSRTLQPSAGISSRSRFYPRALIEYRRSAVVTDHLGAARESRHFRSLRYDPDPSRGVFGDFASASDASRKGFWIRFRKLIPYCRRLLVVVVVVRASEERISGEGPGPCKSARPSGSASSVRRDAAPRPGRVGKLGVGESNGWNPSAVNCKIGQRLSAGGGSGGRPDRGSRRRLPIPPSPAKCAAGTDLAADECSRPVCVTDGRGGRRRGRPGGGGGGPRGGPRHLLSKPRPTVARPGSGTAPGSAHTHSRTLTFTHTHTYTHADLPHRPDTRTSWGPRPAGLQEFACVACPTRNFREEPWTDAEARFDRTAAHITASKFRITCIGVVKLSEKRLDWISNTKRKRRSPSRRGRLRLVHICLNVSYSRPSDYPVILFGVNGVYRTRGAKAGGRRRVQVRPIHGFLLHAVNAQQHVMLIWTPRLYRDPVSRRSLLLPRRRSVFVGGRRETEGARNDAAGRRPGGKVACGGWSDSVQRRTRRKLNALDWPAMAVEGRRRGSCTAEVRRWR
ncbi:hypothetical protein GEV33_009176 [Tenebrio molitor]|uniref:Uncharacterized protein n=1 Tax=Tenebrio molitor TaxID=7067 RepID=A0A8J6HFA7_TENMO|nr:hypothetical protein GEV33_009176 [Tenebrio molitor]